MLYSILSKASTNNLNVVTGGNQKATYNMTLQTNDDTGKKKLDPDFKLQLFEFSL